MSESISLKGEAVNAQKAIRILTVVALLIGLDVIAEPKTHVVDELLKDFRADLKSFQEGLNDSTSQKNFSLEALVLRKNLLLLRTLGTPETKIETVKEFPALAESLTQLIKEEPSLKDISKKLTEKKPLSVADIFAVEKAILTTQKGKEFALKGGLGNLAELFQLETEKKLNPQKSTKEILSEMAAKKLAKFPQDILVGEATPLLKNISEQLRAFNEKKEGKDKKAPTLGDLVAALKSGKFTLDPKDLLELNAFLVPQQVQLTGGLSSSDALADLFRVFVENLPPQRRADVPSFSDFLDRLANTQPRPNPALSAGLRNLGQIEPFRMPGNRNSSGAGSGESFLRNPDGRGASVPFNPAEAVFAGVGLSSSEKECLTKGPKAPQNYEMRMSFASRPGSVSFCSSTPVSLDPKKEKEEPTPSTAEGKVLVNFFIAKHCVEPGDLTSLSIKGVDEPVRKAQILVESPGPSVTGGDDSAVIRVEMSREAAKKLRYMEPATSQEAENQLRGGQGAGIALARNREINVEPNGSPFLFARGYVPGSEQKFSGFAVTNDPENKGQKVKQGDSGGYQVACINGTPKVIGATSTVLINSPGEKSGLLGRAASLASLDWLGTVLKTGQSPSQNSLAQVNDPKKGANSTREAHPSSSNFNLNFN